MNKNMQGENVLILGASKGLGLEIAKLTFDLGATNIKASSTMTDGSKERKFYLKCDLNCEESTQDFIERLTALNKPIDTFIWVAGRFLDGPFEENDSQEVLSTIDTNLRNPILVAQDVWRKMQGSKTPKHFVVVSSTSATKVRDGQAIYALTKAGQYQFAKCLAEENKTPNLMVSVFRPGGMKTEFYHQYPAADYDLFLEPAKVAEKIMGEVLAQREPFIDIEIPRGSL